METQDWICIFETKVRDLKQGDYWKLEFDDSIVPESPMDGWKEYIKNSPARFACSKCSRTWPSNRVMVLFHMRLLQSQGTVKVRRFRQSCKRCANAPMEKPTFTCENIDIFLEKLLEKIRIKCYHQNLGEGKKMFQSERVNSQHEPAHCEACIRGICKIT